MLGTEPALELLARVPCKDQCVRVRVHSVCKCEDTPRVCVCVCMSVDAQALALQVQLEPVGIGSGGPQLHQASAAPLSPSSWPPRSPRD